MSRVETYRHWIQIKIEHEYYTSNVLPLNLFPSKETDTFLSQSGILFRKYSSCQWNLLLPLGEIAEKQLMLWVEENPVLVFDLISLSGEIFYNSSLEERKEDHYSITKTTQSKVWRKFEIPFTISLLQNGTTLDVLIHAIKKHHEFILIPKYNSIDIPLQLSEEKGRIVFDEIEKVKLFNGVEACRCRSKEPVILNENSHYTIKLWEKRKAGNRLLCDTIPIPLYSEISMFNPENTITTYFYY